jgi:hypothetical protein
MKRTKCAAAAGIVLALLCTLTGCPQEAGDPEIDTRLVYAWTDDGEADFYLKRTFTIEPNGDFAADLNPVALGAYADAGGSDNDAVAKATAKGAVDGIEQGQLPVDDTSWQVTGRLVLVDGTLYKMDDLKARESDQQVLLSEEGGQPTITPAKEVLPNFSGQQVNITLADDGSSFTMQSAGNAEDAATAQINMFFGGTYHKAN